MGYVKWVMDNGQWVMDYGLWVMGIPYLANVVETEPTLMLVLGGRRCMLAAVNKELVQVAVEPEHPA